MAEEKEEVNYNHIELVNEGGLKCDSETCDWEDATIPSSEYENWLNKPCPKCGENVLTEEDWNNALKVQEMVKMINSLSEGELETFNKMFGITPEALGLDPDAEYEASIDTHQGIKMEVSKVDPNRKLKVADYKHTYDYAQNLYNKGVRDYNDLIERMNKDVFSELEEALDKHTAKDIIRDAAADVLDEAEMWRNKDQGNKEE